MVNETLGSSCGAGTGVDGPDSWDDHKLTSGNCGVAIDTEALCKQAMEINAPYDNNEGWYTTRSWSDKPPGCNINNGYYYFNTNSYSTVPCSENQKCVCNSRSCTDCPIGYYSEGGDNALCTKCPSNKPYTCPSDGSACLLTGATSVDKCKL